MSLIIVSANVTLNSTFFASGNIYEFNDHHDLQTATINFPANVTLRFKGGSLNNGTLIGNDTIIEATRATIFGKTLAIDNNGTWKIDHAYSDWFDCYKDGYYIDTSTFTSDNGTYQYKYENNTYTFGQLCGVIFNNDRFMLQQLLNLSALHTIITEGIYMVDSQGGTGEHLQNQLTWFNKKGLTLEIEGTLKMIPNSHTNYNVLLVAECDNVLLCGSGKLVGDLPEHQGSTGEGGMCLQVNSTVNMQLQGLTFEQGWGDGVYYSWRRYYSPSGDKNEQEKHSWNNVKCLYNRRSGFVVEKGDYLSIHNSDFNYTAVFNGTATYSGVDIEPFGSDDTPQRYCKEIHFNQCRANYNSGTAFRFERLMGGSVTNSEASFNGGAAVETLRCYEVNEDKVWYNPANRRFFKSHIIIDANTFKDNYITFNSVASSAHITNNFIQNTGSFMNGEWQDSLAAHNKVLNSNHVFSLSGYVHNLLIEHNYMEGLNAPDEGSAYGDSSAIFVIRQWNPGPKHISNLVVQNNIFKYAGNKIIYGSNDSQPMPYPSVKNYLFIVDDHISIENESIRFLNNHFDDELWAPEINNNLYTIYETAGNEKIIQRRTFSIKDLQKTKHLMKGDIIEAYGQKGLVTRGGWLGTIGTAFAHNTTYQRYQIINNGQNTAMSLVVGAGTTAASGGFPYGYGGSGTASIRPINMDYPVIVWQNVGTCKAGDRPIEFNTQGRTLIEVDSGVSTQMIQWDGTSWIIL